MERLQIVKKLEQLDLFEGFDVGEIGEMLERVKFVIRCYRKGGMIVTRSEEHPFLTILLEGTVSVEFVNEEGKVLEVNRIKAPEVIAPGVVFASDPLFPADLIASSNACLMFIKNDDFFNLLVGDKRLVRNFSRLVSDRLLRITKRFYDVSMKELEEKVITYLLGISKRLGRTEFELPHSKEELAKQFGVTRPSVSRVFSSLVKRGMIEQNGRLVKLKRIA